MTSTQCWMVVSAWAALILFAVYLTYREKHRLELLKEQPKVEAPTPPTPEPLPKPEPRDTRPTYRIEYEIEEREVGESTVLVKLQDGRELGVPVRGYAEVQSVSYGYDQFYRPQVVDIRIIKSEQAAREFMKNHHAGVASNFYNMYEEFDEVVFGIATYMKITSTRECKAKIDVAHVVTETHE